MSHKIFCGFAFYLILIPVGAFAVPYTIDTVPNPREDHGGYVSDPDANLDEAEIRQLDDDLIALEKDTSAEYAVVIVDSIGSEIPKDFAVRLFNKWGIGKAGKDNGLLLLVVLDQRRWEFETGYGLEGVLPDATLAQLGRDHLPRHFKAKTYGKGLIEVSKAIAIILRENKAEINMPPEERREREQKRAIEEKQAYQRAHLPRVFTTLGFSLVVLIAFIALAIYIRVNLKPAKEWRPGQDVQMGAMPLYLWIPLVFIWPLMAIYILCWNFNTVFFIYLLGGHLDQYLGYYMVGIGYVTLAIATMSYRIRKINFVAKQKLEAHQLYNGLLETNKNMIPELVAFPMFSIIPWMILKLKLGKLRNTPRTCPTCGNTMHRLGEVEEDPHLDKGQLTEESIGSVDYDVWFCEKDSQVLIEKYMQSSSYTKCEACQFLTSHVVRTWSIQSPTYESSGKGGEEHECKNCGRKKETQFTIPKLVRSSSGSSSGSSSSYSSSSSSSSRSSSSSGGSFGGGRSGGGGAGGSW
ncbi:MAG: TPM domain-containing protein [Leptospirales bacterium]|nr:TPM domain-containing protein [Leptospirales bacterium]